ncbi:YkgJ family cysteine cluster protein [Labilibaculum sp. DW002]|uniref:YkgJ family cysteine cluster protein n=1 Tax=Paralabilibaculum antarcticum TaxID=2912572 RepID=A0ABT5VS97_9BACT|nr:YkgJ family cysteine cluster protein [Labilibaculum sp. DW002]MDE5418268.1 YkgJ family cysteine cluster protein [Labilibaculum sp. DW002]
MGKIEIDLERLKQQAKNTESETKDLFNKLKKKKPKQLDTIVHGLHNEVFEEIDCLECANCCKSISPIIIDKDIERMAKQLRMKPSAFIDQYLNLDNENDYVFKQAPCPFLMPDNYCMVYEQRPRACREYPHTDRKRFYQILNLTLKNTHYCPAVYEVVDRLKLKRDQL